MCTSGETREISEEKTEKVKSVVNLLIAAYQSGDPEQGAQATQIPMMEIIEWKGRANIWCPSPDEFRQTIEARKNEPLVQETVEEAVEWFSEHTAIVFRRIKTTVPGGQSFLSPAFFLVTPDREGTFKVAFSWWGAFPDWFQG